MIHRSQVGRQDLIKCLRAMPEVPLELLARLCGYEPNAALEPEKPRPSATAPRSSPPVSPPAPGPQPPPRLDYLIPVSAHSRDPAAPSTAGPGKPPLICQVLDEQGDRIKVEELAVRDDVVLPKAPPLQPWPRLWPFLRRALGHWRDSGRVDCRPLVRLLAAGRPVLRLPRLRYSSWAGRVRVLLDHRPGLLPFRDDMALVLDGIRQQHGREGLEITSLLDGRPPQTLPPSGEPVLLLGDLGCLPQDPVLSAAWRAYGRRLRRAGVPATALLPCPRNRWEAGLALTWVCACWDRGQRLPRWPQGLRHLPPVADPDRSLGVERLLTVMAPALRIEPGLLRSIRLLLAPAQADVGVEYDAWHHPDAVHDASAMGLRAQCVLARRREHLLSVRREVKAALIRLLRAWHANCAATVRAAEVLGLAESGAPVSSEELARARQTQNRAAALLLNLARDGRRNEATALGFTSWQQRELARSTPEARTAEEHLAVGWAIMRSWGNAGTAQVPVGLNREIVECAQKLLLEDPGPGREALWQVWQRGEELILRPWPMLRSGPSDPISTGAPLAGLRARRPQFHLEIEASSGRRELYHLATLEDQEMRYRVGRPRRLGLYSDCGELVLVPQPRPTWAKRFGSDKCGLFAEFDLEGVAFRLRWIPPGSFLMGSPETELGRFSDEGPRHLVTISRGFWLGDTPCTQAQWQAVMGENPSHFKDPYDPNRPVESVSLGDCGQFCARLEQRIPELAFRLPTEAEWEYACRAGTTSAFNDGSDCIKPEGEDPALKRLAWHAEGEKGQTHPVGEKQPNAWGLHDMHGNVWEWCADQAEWEAKVVTDTYVDGIVDPVCQSGAGRVVRGGSSWNHARFCRSAYRGASEPGNRSSYLGFRLAAGQPPGRGAPSPAAAGAVAPGPEAPAVSPASGASPPDPSRQSAAQPRRTNK